MRQLAKQSSPQILEVFEFRFPHLAEQQAFQSIHTLTIIHTHLREQPVRLPATARTAVTDRRRPIRFIALSRRSAGDQLSFLQA